MNRRIAHAAQIVAVVLALALVPAALAAKGGASGGGGGGHHSSTPTSYTGTLAGPVMVTDNNGNGSPNFGDSITFNVTSNAPYYYVRADCYQNSSLVWEDYEGFYTGWAWGTTYGLGGQLWKSGGANCTAVLYSQNADGTNTQTLATMSFNVGA